MVLPQLILINKLNRTQVFADPPAMQGTSGQVYADNNLFFINLKNLRSLARRIYLPGQRSKKEIPIP